MPKTDFLSLRDFDRAELDAILAKAKKLKAQWRSGETTAALKGQVLGLIFHKPSLRTRVSFEVGMRQLGGDALYITDKEIGFGKREAIQDIGAVISRYVNGLMIRTFAQDDVAALARAADVPVINGLTDALHPCQVLCDLFTLVEKGVELDGLRIAYLGDGNNLARSWMHAAMIYPLDLRLACPEGFEPAGEEIERAQQQAPGKVRLLRDPREAVSGAQVVYTDTWTSMGQEAETERRRQVFPPYQVNAALLQDADAMVKVMHCLPAHRGDEITAEVLMASAPGSSERSSRPQPSARSSA